MRRMQDSALIGISMLAIVFGVLLSLLLLRLPGLKTLSAPQASILAPVITGIFTTAGLFISRRLNLILPDPAIVYFDQEIVIKVNQGEYVSIELDANGGRLKATTTDIRKAQRFKISVFLQPFSHPTLKPVQFEQEIVFRLADKKVVVTGNRNLSGIPLYLGGKAAGDSEKFILFCPESSASDDDKTLRFGDAFHIKSQNNMWVYCNFENDDRTLYALIDAAQRGPYAWESFSVEDPRRPVRDRS